MQVDVFLMTEATLASQQRSVEGSGVDQIASHGPLGNVSCPRNARFWKGAMQSHQHLRVSDEGSAI